MVSPSSISGSAWRAFGARLAIAIVVVGLLSGTAVAAAFWYAHKKVDEIERVDGLDGVLDPEPDDPAEPANFLIIGSDTRAFVEDDRDVESFGDPEEQTGQRSDTMMVVHVDPGGASGMVLSFPRDLWVDIPGRGESKINAAFNDGPGKVIETIQSNFDIPVHHYLEVDFASFEALVSAIGSVDIYFPTPARDTYTGLNAPFPGCYALDGREALNYVRSRYYEWYDPEREEWRDDPRADIGRIARQQYFIRSLAQEAVNEGARNPLTAKRLLDRMVPNLRSDPGLDWRDITSLVRVFEDLDPSRVPMETLPYTPNESGSILYPDFDAAGPILERMRTFEPVEPPTVPSFEIPDLDPAEVAVRVLNGSGVGGVASEALAGLEGQGFVGVEAADAETFDYSSSVVRYAPGDEDAALIVLLRLGGRADLEEVTSIPGADVEVVVGTDFDGVRDPADPAEPEPPASTTSTTVVIAPGDATDFGLPEAANPNAGLPLVGCPPGS